MLPDPPQYYASVKDLDRAREVLVHVRGGDSKTVEEEFFEICTIAEDSKPSSPIKSAKVPIGRGEGDAPHLGRRAWLCLWLQIMPVYSPVLLSQAGYSNIKQNRLAEGLNTIRIVRTIISAQIVDRLGRRICLMGGVAVLFAINLIVGLLYESTIHDPGKAASIAPPAVTMLFLFNLIYAATWSTIAFLVPTEIFPSEMRAKGSGFGITGRAVGVWWTVLIPIIYFFYLETKDHSLESINVLCSSSSPFHFAMEQSYGEQGYVIAMKSGREEVEQRISVISTAIEKGEQLGHYEV